MTSLSHSAFSMKFSRGGGGGVSPFQMGVKSNINLKQGCIFFQNPPPHGWWRNYFRYFGE